MRNAFLIVIHVEAESTAAAPERYEDFPRQASFADAEDGVYEVRDLPAGNYTVEARSPGLAPGRRSPVAYADWVAAWLRDRADGPAAVLGYSMGGSVALLLAVVAFIKERRIPARP